MSTTFVRVLTATAVSAALAVAAAAPAAAHVTVKPAEASSGSYATLTFQVPNEDDVASTTELAVTVPTDEPITSVAVQPRPGWSYTVERQVLDEPVVTGHGEVTEVVSAITWTADDEAAAIAPGEFETFVISAGPLPTAVDMLTFPAVQTYSDGQIVSWIETAAPGAPTPDHPAPALTLTDGDDVDTDIAANGGSVGDDGTDTALVVAGVALAVAILAAGGTGMALLRRR